MDGDIITSYKSSTTHWFDTGREIVNDSMVYCMNISVQTDFLTIFIWVACGKYKIIKALLNIICPSSVYT